MNRNELLDKLAMELSEWPIDMPPPNLPGLWSCHHEWRCQAMGDAKQIFGHEWLQRRIELINEPDDSEAPEWAKWRAQDADGVWTWFEDSAYADEDTNEWLESDDCDGSGGIRTAAKGKIPAGHHWQDTLTEVNQARELNPPSSSLTDSQAHEQATEFKTCSDGTACGTPPSIGDDAYCAECPNLPSHEADARSLDAQLERCIEAFQGLCDEVAAESEQLSPDKHYHHSYKGIKLDPYRIARIYEMRGGPREQIMKKCLRFTDKGQTEQQVINEVRSALKRWQEMLDEDAEH